MQSHGFLCQHDIGKLKMDKALWKKLKKVILSCLTGIIFVLTQT